MGALEISSLSYGLAGHLKPAAITSTAPHSSLRPLCLIGNIVLYAVAIL